MAASDVRALIVFAAFASALGARPFNLDPVVVAREPNAKHEAPSPQVASMSQGKQAAAVGSNQPAAQLSLVAIDDLLSQLRRQLLQPNSQPNASRPRESAQRSSARHGSEQSAAPVSTDFRWGSICTCVQRWISSASTWSIRCPNLSLASVAMFNTNLFMILLMWRMCKEATSRLFPNDKIFDPLAREVESHKAVGNASTMNVVDEKCIEAARQSPTFDTKPAGRGHDEPAVDEHQNEGQIALAPEALPVPESFKCPITAEIMCDPVSTVDGLTYERESILAWFRLGKRTSPLTNASLPSLMLTPNIALRGAIAEFRRLRPELEQREMLRRDFEAAVAAWQSELENLREKCAHQGGLLEQKDAAIKEQHFKIAMLEVAASAISRRLTNGDCSAGVAQVSTYQVAAERSPLDHTRTAYDNAELEVGVDPPEAFYL